MQCQAIGAQWLVLLSTLRILWPSRVVKTQVVMTSLAACLICHCTVHDQHTLPLLSYILAINIWDFENGEYDRGLKGHTNAVTDVCLDALGHILASASADLTIKMWDFTTFKCTKVGADANI